MIGGSNLAGHLRRVADDGTPPSDIDGTIFVELVALAPIDLGPAEGNPGFKLPRTGMSPTDTTGKHASDQGSNPDNSSIRTSLPTGVNEFDQFRHFLLSHGI